MTCSAAACRGHRPSSTSGRRLIVTLDTALIGTTIGLALSLLITPFAARNLSPHRLVYEASRILIAFTRTIPAFIFALYMVVVVGLGPYPVALALAIHSVGTLGKLFAETIEDMDMGAVDALRAAGAGRLQVFLHAVLPGVAPSFVSLSLYRFDVNVRDSLAAGFVGGAGIGFLLFNSISSSSTATRRWNHCDARTPARRRAGVNGASRPDRLANGPYHHHPGHAGPARRVLIRVARAPGALSNRGSTDRPGAAHHERAVARAGTDP